MYHKKLFDGSEVFIDLEYNRVPKYLSSKKKGKPEIVDVWVSISGEKGIFSPRGGRTICTLRIVSKSGDELKLSTSALCSMSDAFCKKTGRELTLKRLTDKLSKFRGDENLGEFGVAIRDAYNKLLMLGMRKE